MHKSDDDKWVMSETEIGDGEISFPTRSKSHLDPGCSITLTKAFARRTSLGSFLISLSIDEFRTLGGRET